MKTTNQTFATYLPIFQGFYGTLFETDSLEDYELGHINEEREFKGLPSVNYENVEFDYQTYFRETSINCCSYIDEELNKIFKNVKVEFEELVSPKEYNFSNDSINCSITLDITELIKYLKDNKESFAEYIKEKYTSRDGFSSFYSNDSQDWLDYYILNENKHAIGSCLEFVFENENKNIDELEQVNIYNMYEYCINNDMVLNAKNYDELIEA